MIKDIHARVPVNSTAANVVKPSHERDRLHVDRETTDIRSAVPLPTRSLDGILGQPNFIDLTGRKIGKLTVIGLSTLKATKVGGSRWVCRCVCGYYVHRTARVIKSETEYADQACKVCYYVQHLKGENKNHSPNKRRIRVWCHARKF